MDDLVIVGLGPAGLTASIYASRYKLKNLVIGETLAGELSKAHKIENLPGFDIISGIEWGEKTKGQVEKLGAEVVIERVGRIEISNKRPATQKAQKDSIKGTKFFVVTTESGKKYQARTLIVAMGSERRKLGIPGEKEYLGKGISYCTTCDAPFFRGKTVALIGGSDSAVSGAVHTAEFAKKVYIIYRRDKLRAEPIWVEEWEKAEKNGKGVTIYKTNIVKILGYKDIKILREKQQLNNRTIEQSSGESLDKVAAVELDQPYKNSKYLSVDGVFIEIGGVPASSLLKPLGVEMTETDYVKVSEAMETNLAGLYAAGDITDRSAVLVQAITAMAQGAMAAASVYKFLKGEKAPKILGI